MNELTHAHDATELGRDESLEEQIDALIRRCVEEERSYSIVAEVETKPNDMKDAHVVRTASGSMGLAGGIRVIGDLAEVMMSQNGLTHMEVAMIVGMIARRKPDAQAVIEWRKLAALAEAMDEREEAGEKAIN